MWGLSDCFPKSDDHRVGYSYFQIKMKLCSILCTTCYSAEISRIFLFQNLQVDSSIKPSIRQREKTTQTDSLYTIFIQCTSPLPSLSLSLPLPLLLPFPMTEEAVPPAPSNAATGFSKYVVSQPIENRRMINTSFITS